MHVKIDKHLLGWTSGSESQCFIIIVLYNTIFKKLLITRSHSSLPFSYILHVFVSVYISYRDSSLDNMISVTDMYPSCILSDSAFTPFLSKYLISSYVYQADSRHMYYQMTDQIRRYFSRTSNNIQNVLGKLPWLWPENMDFPRLIALCLYYNLIFGLSSDELNAKLNDFLWVTHSKAVQGLPVRVKFTCRHILSFG